MGDPIAQSKSPTIHKYWLEQMNIRGDYRRTRVQTAEFAAFFEGRRADADWCGCNVTIPHKEAAAALVDRLDASARAIGAVNCVVPDGGALVGYNTDIDGVAVALRSAEIRGCKAVVVGAGGAARAAVVHLVAHGVGRLAVLVRNPDRAKSLEPLAPGEIDILPFDQAEAAFRGAAVIVNASPLGMADADRMPRPILDALSTHTAGATVFDMITTPSRTEFLAAAEAGGGHPVDGITMLLGQASRAFELFFGAPAPSPDQRLRDLLATDSCD